MDTTASTEFDERETRALAALYESDRQLRDARPLPEVATAIARPGLSFAEYFATLVEGYGDRPALGERATEPVLDHRTGRTSRRLLPHFDTISYRALGARVEAVAAEWQHHEESPLHEGDFVAILGAGSIDYLTVDIAAMRLGATVVPLESTAATATLRPVVAEAGPRILAARNEFLHVAVELAAHSPTVRRLVVLDHHPEVDEERERLEAARTGLAGTDIDLVTVAALVERGRTLPAAPRPAADPDRLSLLLYTSGSTGTPKGAMYPDRLVRWMWRGYQPRVPGQAVITVSYLPLSHSVGRTMTVSTLAQGGTVYFVASGDLSTLFEDMALVRPTELVLVPRVCDMIFQHFQGERDRRTAAGADRTDVAAELRAEVRTRFLGGRVVFAISLSAPLSPELRAFLEELLAIPVHDFYGSTEGGGITLDGRFQRPQVLGYRLADVPELGYFSTDSPYPRGELLIRARTLVPGYFQRPDVTAEVFDAEGYYHTGDIMAEIAPGQVVYVDRAKNVVKLSQGEFVALSKLEALFATADSIQQIFVYGESERSYLLAVVVPTADAVNSVHGDLAELRPRIAASIRQLAGEAGLASYEIPRDLLLETEPFTPGNGLLTGARKLMRPNLEKHYRARLTAMYEAAAERANGQLRELRRTGGSRPVLDTVVRAARAVLEVPAAGVRAESHFLEQGGDSLSALSFSTLLGEIFGVPVPVSILTSPANDLRAVARHVKAALDQGSGQPTYASVHGEGGAVARAADLTLDKFPGAAGHAARPPSEVTRTVLLTGANGYLGRFLCLDWLERIAATGGTLVCLVRGGDAAAARARLEEAFDSGDPALSSRFRELAAGRLEVLAGDIGEPELGLDTPTWLRLAGTVDAIVHPAALVNHVLPYDQLFGPNVVGTAELIRLAVTARLKPFTYVSTVAVLDEHTGTAGEDDDIRTASPRRILDGSYADGYAASKWAGEVLLREAHDTTGLPVTVFRSDMILAHTRYAGQLNLPDLLTRLLYSLIITGIAPPSFYRDEPGERPHYDGLPVDFTAEAIATLGARATTGYETYNLLNTHDDGISLDTFVDWLTGAGYRIQRMDSYAGWLDRFTTALRALPEKQKQQAVLPLLSAFAEPTRPAPGPPAERFRAAVRQAGVGPGKDVPHITAELIRKYAADLTRLGLLPGRAGDPGLPA